MLMGFGRPVKRTGVQYSWVDFDKHLAHQAQTAPRKRAGGNEELLLDFPWRGEFQCISIDRIKFLIHDRAQARSCKSCFRLNRTEPRGLPETRTVQPVLGRFCPVLELALEGARKAMHFVQLLP
ncbi:Protein kinase domain-containing protein [Psidium guajava]|nr:Protein kinase domain-containing protein [Psidium guajava]